MVLDGAWSWIPSEYGACPLCGLGEGGVEHLLLWCLAIAFAWRLLAAGYSAADINKIWGGNALRVLKTTEAVRDRLQTRKGD